jgi:hypothetical protein
MSAWVNPPLVDPGAVAFTGGTGVPIAYCLGGIPFIKAPSGSMANNGAVSGMTALPDTYVGGAYLWLPASAISAGSGAGWYWFVGSSTTAGTVYNSTYTSGIPVAGVTTAFATTGPGAFTGDTGVVTAVSVTLPANVLKLSGRAWFDGSMQVNGTAGAKVITINFGSLTPVSLTLNATPTAAQVRQAYIQNRGIATRQTYGFAYSNSSNGASGQVSAQGNLDTTANVTCTLTVQTSGAATDYVVLPDYNFWYAAQ